MGFPIESDQQERSRLSDTVAHGVAVVGGCGYVPVAPGTAGSAAGAVLFVAAVGLLEAAGLRGVAALGIHAAIAIGLCVVGVWAAGHAEERFGRHDDGRIVIDEVAGQWVALLPLAVPAVSGAPLADTSGFFSAVVTAFVLFRVFDVWKPGVIRWVERRLDGGWGVMADDLVAGVHAALVLSLILLGQARLASAAALHSSLPGTLPIPGHALGHMDLSAGLDAGLDAGLNAGLNAMTLAFDAGACFCGCAFCSCAFCGGAGGGAVA